jgi:hypothetical protein
MGEWADWCEVHASYPNQAQAWRPIETAPRGGSFLAAIHHGDACGYLVVMAKWIGPGVNDVSEGSCVGWRPGHKHPAYWRPLPPPPSTGGL